MLLVVEEGNKELKMTDNNDYEMASVSSDLLKMSKLKSLAKNLLTMLMTSEFDKSDKDFYRKLDSQLYQLNEYFPGPITLQKLDGLDVTCHEDLLQLERFADLYYGQILQCLLSKVDDIDWFDQSSAMIPDCLSRLIAVDGATLTILNESLVTICDILKTTPNKASKLDICVKLLESLVKCDAIQSAYLDIGVLCNDRDDPTLSDRNATKNLVKMENRKEVWNSSVQLFVSLPHRICNKLGGNCPDIFLRENFSRLCCHHIAKCVKHSAYIKIHGQNKTLFIECLSKFFSKILFNFNGTKALKDLIKIFYFWCSSNEYPTETFKEVVQKLFMCLDSVSIEVAAVHVLSYSFESRLADVSQLLGYDIIDIGGWYHVLLNKLPLMSFMCEIVAIKNLIFYLGKVQLKHDTYDGPHNSSGPIKNYALSDLLLQLLTVWSDKTALTHTPVEQHLYISKIIILSVNFITSQFINCNFFNLKMYINSIKLKLFNGLPEHLQSTSEIVRAIGMVTAECIIKNINSIKFSDDDKGIPLEFDYSEVKEDLLLIINDLKQLSCYKFIQEDFLDGESHEHLLDLLESLDTKSETCSEKHTVVVSKKPTVIVRETQSSCVDEDDEILDSDDDLVSYDLSNDIKILETKRPKYLRDLIKNLVEANDRIDPDVWIASLEACEQLVYKQLPNDDVSLGFELIDILLSMEMKFFCANFDNLKFSSALAVVVVYPAEMAEYICKKFHEDYVYSISQRLLMLDLLSGGAKVLSDPSNDPVKKDNYNKFNLSSSALTFVKPLQTSWEEVVKDRINAKTRRIHKTKIPQIVGKKNIFAKVAGSFFFPLIRGSGKVGPGIMFRVNADTEDSAENSLLLLVHMLRTCAIVMACSVNCYVAVKMARELLEATWSLRFHFEAKVREEVISCTAAVILATPKSILKNDLGGEVMDAKLWLEQIVNSLGIIKSSACEVDAKCRHFAGQVVMLIDSVLCIDD